MARWEMLRQARDRAGLSQRQLAERAGTSQAMVARIESGPQSPSMARSGCLLVWRSGGGAFAFRSRPSSGSQSWARFTASPAGSRTQAPSSLTGPRRSPARRRSWPVPPRWREQVVLLDPAGFCGWAPVHEHAFATQRT
jgi:hypothetical protein